MGNTLTVAKRKNNNDFSRYPDRKTRESAGLDLYASMSISLKPMDRVLMATGILMNIPAGHYGKIHDTSSLALNHGIQVHQGIIDSDYTGEIFVLLFNLSTVEVKIGQGTKIAQIIIASYLKDEPLILPDYEADNPYVYRVSSRNRSGFGIGDTNKLVTDEPVIHSDQADWEIRIPTPDIPLPSEDESLAENV
jgi:dUTP pyrophosphatase